MAKNSKVVGALILILLVASFLRLYSLDSMPPGLYSDEAMNGSNATEALASGDFRVFYAENNGREGFFINIQVWLIGFIGPAGLIGPVGLLRLPSAIFGILTVLGIYFLTKELFGNKNLALLAAFLIATSFWHINFSRIGFRAIMAPAFLTWGLYFLLVSYRTYKSYWSYLLPLLAGAVYGLGMHSYIAYRATPLLILLVFYLVYKSHRADLSDRNYWTITAIFTAAAIIVFLPLGMYFLENPADFFGRTGQISVWQSPAPLKDLGLNILKTAGMFNVAGDWNPRHNLPGAPLLWWPVGILFLVGLIISIRSLFRNWKLEIGNLESSTKFANLILLAWLIITALPVIISNEGMPHALRAILMAPPVFIFAAWGGVRLFEKLRPVGPIRFIGLVGLIVFAAANAYISYFLDWTKRADVAEAFNAKYVGIAEEINALPASTPKYLVIDTGGHDIRKIGSPAQTIMYLTDTYLPEKQKEKNIYYISPAEASELSEFSE